MVYCAAVIETRFQSKRSVLYTEIDPTTGRRVLTCRVFWLLNIVMEAVQTAIFPNFFVVRVFRVWKRKRLTLTTTTGRRTVMNYRLDRWNTRTVTNFGKKQNSDTTLTVRSKYNCTSRGSFIRNGSRTRTDYYITVDRMKRVKIIKKETKKIRKKRKKLERSSKLQKLKICLKNFMFATGIQKRTEICRFA